MENALYLFIFVKSSQEDSKPCLIRRLLMNLIGSLGQKKSVLKYIHKALKLASGFKFLHDHNIFLNRIVATFLE